MNLGLLAPGPSDGTSWYRCHGVFSYVSREYGVRLHSGQEWDWPQITELDAMFMQRPFTSAHVMVARMCAVLNVPLWVDYDDLYESFPAWVQNQQVTQYGIDAALANMRECIRLATAVTVSTDELLSLSPKAEVIPNAFNAYVWAMSHAPRAKVVSWRGSGGHGGDIDPHIDSLKSVAKDFPEWRFKWFGRPHFKCDQIGEVIRYSDLFTYMQQLFAAAPAVHIVPLADCRFNRAKSNIAWLEATAAGALVVAPDWTEWQLPGVINYRGDDEFEDCVRRAMLMDDDEREQMVDESRRHICDRFTLSNVNRQRAEILKKLKPQ